MISDHMLKFILVGDSGVGKSALITRFAEGMFCDEYISTIGADFRFKDIQVGGKKIKLQLWGKRVTSATTA
jgi:GTPase SAR1 family protein